MHHIKIRRAEKNRCVLFLILMLMHNRNFNSVFFILFFCFCFNFSTCTHILRDRLGVSNPAFDSFYHDNSIKNQHDDTNRNKKPFSVRNVIIENIIIICVDGNETHKNTRDHSNQRISATTMTVNERSSDSQRNS